jgi:multiple sugar transport system substrate-binding protein
MQRGPEPTVKKRIGIHICATAVAAGLALTACGGSNNGATSTKVVNVALPLGPVPASVWAPFEKQTGIHVNYTNVEYGSLQTKIAAAGASNTYFADVTDVDWSKTGEYSQTKWFLPLNKYFNTQTLKSNFPAMGAFINNKGTYYGIPGDSQFLVTTVNVKDFRAAGINTMPSTLAQYTSDLEQVKAKGVVAHPLGIPLAAAEYLSTYWYELTNAYGGNPLTCNYAPTFASPSSAGYKALAWIVNAYKSGLVPPGDINEIVTPVEAEMASNQVASLFSDYSGNVLIYYDNKSNSSVVGDVQYINTPGVSGLANNFTDPDGIGIPVTAQNTAGAVKFMKWYTSPAGQLRLATLTGVPANAAADASYEKAFPNVGQPTLDTLVKQHARPAFPCGAPPWYSQFSDAVQTNIHAAAAGQKSVAAAVQAIYSAVQSLRQQ